jgi:hypothetical protein
MYMNKIRKKYFRQKINYCYYYYVLTVIQCKQRYTRTMAAKNFWPSLS